MCRLPSPDCNTDHSYLKILQEFSIGILSFNLYIINSFHSLFGMSMSCWAVSSLAVVVNTCMLSFYVLRSITSNCTSTVETIKGLWTNWLSILHLKWSGYLRFFPLLSVCLSRGIKGQHLLAILLSVLLWMRGRLSEELTLLSCGLGLDLFEEPA